MPKLSKKLTKQVDKAEAVHGYGLLTPGKYWARLAKVEAGTNRGGEVWAWEFDQLHTVDDDEKVAGRQWYRTNMPKDEMPSDADPKKFQTAQEMALGRLKAAFEAFGYTTDTDTDEMIGEWAVITVAIRTIKEGPRSGEKTNEVTDIEDPEEYGDHPEVEEEPAGPDPAY